MNSVQKIWYALYTKSRNEKRVALFLKEQEVEHYLPLIKKHRQWSDRKKIVEEPLFASYIFVHIYEKEHWQILKIPGVVKFITFEGKKIPVRDLEIEAIRIYTENGEELITNEADFSPGKQVKVIRGQFKDIQGRLIQILGKQRVKIEIEAIGKSVYLKIPMSSLQIETNP